MKQHNEPLVFGLAGEAPVREPLRYTACGLDNVYLCSGFEQEVVDGETYTSVAAVEKLHVMIAFHLCVLRRPLKGKEVAFLRKRLGLTQEELAEAFRVTRKTVNSYEREDGSIPINSQIVLQPRVANSLLKTITKLNATDAKAALSFRAVVTEVVDWLLELKSAHEDEDEMPPAFIADAALGRWKITACHH